MTIRLLRAIILRFGQKILYPQSFLILVQLMSLGTLSKRNRGRNLRRRSFRVSGMRVPRFRRQIDTNLQYLLGPFRDI